MFDLYREVVVVGLPDDVAAVVPGDDRVRGDVQSAAEAHRVALGDVTVAQLRRELERRPVAGRLDARPCPGLRHRPQTVPPRLRRQGFRRRRPRRKYIQSVQRRQRSVRTFVVVVVRQQQHPLNDPLFRTVPG